MGLPIGFDRISWKRLRWCGVPVLAMAYRLASIGLVGNKLDSSILFLTILSLPIGFDRISWKRCNFRYNACTIGCLPIGFDRISWKPAFMAAALAFIASRLPIGFDRISWKLARNLPKSTSLHLAYRLASIGLVGNQRLHHQQGWKERCLPIGFDRISWKLTGAGPQRPSLMAWLTDWLRSD